MNDRTKYRSEMLDVVIKSGPVSLREVAETVGCHKEHVRQTFESWVGRDMIEISKGTGMYGADEFFLVVG